MLTVLDSLHERGQLRGRQKAGLIGMAERQRTGNPEDRYWRYAHPSHQRQDSAQASSQEVAHHVPVGGEHGTSPWTLKQV